MTLMALAMVAGYILNRREWNGGICRENGMQWEYFDTDSGGARGYVAGDRTCWIGWGVDSANNEVTNARHCGQKGKDHE